MNASPPWFELHAQTKFWTLTYIRSPMPNSEGTISWIIHYYIEMKHKQKTSVILDIVPSNSVRTKSRVSCTRFFVNFTVHKITLFQVSLERFCIYTGTIEAVLKPLPAWAGSTLFENKVRSLEFSATGVDWTELNTKRCISEYNVIKIRLSFFVRGGLLYLLFVLTCFWVPFW